MRPLVVDIRPRSLSEFRSTEDALDRALVHKPELNRDLVEFGGLVVLAVGLSQDAGNKEPPGAFCSFLVPRLQLCAQRGVGGDQMGVLLQGALNELRGGAPDLQNCLTLGYWVLMAPCMLPNAMYWLAGHPTHKLAVDAKSRRQEVLGALAGAGVETGLIEWMWEPFVKAGESEGRNASPQPATARPVPRGEANGGHRGTSAGSVRSRAVESGTGTSSKREQRPRMVGGWVNGVFTGLEHEETIRERTARLAWDRARAAVGTPDEEAADEAALEAEALAVDEAESAFMWGKRPEDEVLEAKERRKARRRAAAGPGLSAQARTILWSSAAVILFIFASLAANEWRKNVAIEAEREAKEEAEREAMYARWREEAEAEKKAAEESAAAAAAERARIRRQRLEGWRAGLPGSPERMREYERAMQERKSQSPWAVAAESNRWDPDLSRASED